MQAIYAFGLVLLIAFLGSQFIIRKKKFFSPLTFLFISGSLYIFLGFYLGKRALNILSPDVLQGLTPLVNLGLGWIGFLFGFQFEYRYLKRFPQRYIGLSFLQFIAVLVLTSLPLSCVFSLFFPQESSFLLFGMALALGLLVSLNSPTLLTAAAPHIRSRGNVFYLARFLVSVSGFWGICGLALFSSFWHFPFSDLRFVPEGFVWLAASIVFPILIGYLFRLLTRKITPREDFLVYLLGLVFFVSGVSYYFNLPPLFTGMILGTSYSNMTRKHEKIYPLLLSTEKPLYVVFLILIGALWEFNLDAKIALLVVLLLLLRTLGYVLPAPLLGKVMRFPFPLSPRFGFIFLSAGGIGVAFAISLKLAYPLPLTDVFLSISLLTIVLGEILSPLGLRGSLLVLDSRKKE